MSPRFLQIHTLISYPASLLNRDDVGFAKRIPFGGSERTRISSQCLKRHWRRADDENALSRVPAGDGATVPMAVRSRRTFEEHILRPLVDEGIDPEVASAVTEELLETVFPKGKRKKGGDEEDGEDVKVRTDQVTVIGRPEIDYLLAKAREAAAGAGNAKQGRQAVKDVAKGDLKKNLQEIKRGAGLDAALFGRMVTGDILARCDAAIHVAHAFTVHPGQFETDYFSAVDDLQGAEETGSGHINTSELASGLYYGYLVVDVPLLVSNLEGIRAEEWERADRTLAGEVIRRLIHLAATVSPGAKLGSTAPYAHALAVLVEAGRSQPRTLANAFLDAVPARHGLLAETYTALARHLEELDGMYGRTTERRLAGVDVPAGLLERVDERLDLPSVANWAAERARTEA